MIPACKKDLHLLGKLLCQHRPEVADELSTLLCGETDLNKLSVYLSAFCSFNGISTNQMQGSIFSHTLNENRRFFISAILSIYRPHTRRLHVSLSNLLRINKSNLSKLIDEQEARCKNPHYRKEVEELAEKLKEGV